MEFLDFLVFLGVVDKRVEYHQGFILILVELLLKAFEVESGQVVQDFEANNDKGEGDERKLLIGFDNGCIPHENLCQ